MKTRMTQWVLAATLTFCCAMMMLTSCTNDAIGSTDNPVPVDPEPPAPQELADYTILFYGHGSEPSLDYCIVQNLQQLYAAASGLIRCTECCWLRMTKAFKTLFIIIL